MTAKDKRDVESKSLKEFDKVSGKVQPIGGSFLKKNPVIENSLERDVTKAGAMICQLMVDANLPFATAHKMTAVVKLIFHTQKLHQVKHFSFFILC